MLVRIKRDHIARGKRADNKACPVALALAKDFHANGGVYVDLEFMYIGPFRYPVSEQLARWLDDFDKGRTVKPIHIHLGEREFAIVEASSKGLLEQRVGKPGEYE